MPNFTLDQDAARKAGQPGRIQSTGRYKGTITDAWYEESEGGAQAFKFKFKSDDGQSAELAVWTHNKDGKPLSGFNLVQALMACCSLRSLNSAQGTVELYDRHEKKDVPKVRQVYAEIAGKKVGLFLETEVSMYTKDDGQDGEYTRMLLAAPFRYEDGKMAAEILDKKPKAEQADKFEAYLMAKKPRVQDQREKPGDRDARGVYGGHHTDPLTDDDPDGIPF